MWQLNIINIIYLQCNLYYTICHPQSVCIRLLFAFYCLFTLSKSKFPFNCTLYREKFELFTPLVVTYQLLVLIVCRQNSWEAGWGDPAVPADQSPPHHVRLRGGEELLLHVPVWAGLCPLTALTDGMCRSLTTLSTGTGWRTTGGRSPPGPALSTSSW